MQASIFADVLRTADDAVGTGNVSVSSPGIGIETCLPHRISGRVLKGQTPNVGTGLNLCLALEIPYEDLAAELVNYIGRGVTDERQLPVDPSEMNFSPAELFTQLEIPVADFQETNIFQVHHARCTGKMSFRNSGPRNNWIWIQAGGPDMYGELRTQAVARLVGLFKIRNMWTRVAMRLAFVQVVDPVNGG